MRVKVQLSEQASSQHDMATASFSTTWSLFHTLVNYKYTMPQILRARPGKQVGNVCMLRSAVMHAPVQVACITSYTECRIECLHS